MSRRLPQYSGALTTSQIAEGMQGASRNARRLTDDARFMLDSPAPWALQRLR